MTARTLSSEIGSDPLQAVPKSSHAAAEHAVPGIDAIAVVVVTYQSADHLADLIDAVVPQLGENDEVAIVDNGSTDGTPGVARSLHERVDVIETNANLGFAGGCQVGAEATQAPLLLFLNPDSRPQPGCLDHLRAAATAHPEWGAWQAAVLLDDEHINASRGVVHYLGMGWAGDCERPISALPDADCEIPFPSGAAMVVRRSVWAKLGGLDREYFMYVEDLDLGLRLWLAGHSVGLVPAARVTHGYEFDKGSAKWFWLERNRSRTVLSVYPLALLVLIAPALLAAELGLLLVAARQGWLRSKLRAQAASLSGLPRTLARRRTVQATRSIGAAEFAGHLTSSLDSPYLSAADSRWLSAPQALYWTLVLRILSLAAR